MDTFRPNISEDILERHVRFNVLCGSILITHHERCLELDWKWIPLVGFFLGLNRATHFALTTGRGVSYFIENDETIEILVSGEQVTVKASFSDEKLQCDAASWDGALSEFKRKLTEAVPRVDPVLAHSASYERLMNTD